LGTPLYRARDDTKPNRTHDERWRAVDDLDAKADGLARYRGPSSRATR
jgi:hypothetical protein